MGKRVVAASADSHHILTSTPPVRTIRKRKRNSLNANAVCKTLRLSNSNNYSWHENDDEDSSSNDAPLKQPSPMGRNQSTKQANNSSILLNSSLTTILDASVNESPKPVYTLRPSVVNGTVLHDLTKKPWRLGRPIGKGNFGEIFLASDNIAVPVSNENAKFVVKIEPHSNGPLFVEIHCLMNTAKKNPDDNEKTTESRTISHIPPSGIPDYIASGSHFFGDARYRFLVLQRFDRDLHSLIRNCRVNQKSVLTLAIQIVDVLEKLHDKGYCHNDVKAQNLMISKCKYNKQQDRVAATNGKCGMPSIKGKYMDHDDEKQQTTDSGNSSEQEGANDDDDDGDFIIKSKAGKYNKYDNDDDDEDFDDGATSQSNNSYSMDIYTTPVNKNRKRGLRANAIEYSGSNPVRSCRLQKRNSIYEEMVKSHYLRPTKRISYSEFFHEDASMKGMSPTVQCISSDDESEEFLPQSARRSITKSKTSCTTTSAKRLTRRQEKLSLASAGQQQQQRHHHAQHSTPATANTMTTSLEAVEEERIFLIDFGLASKFMDNGVHRPFVMDQRRAHDGTLEFTSRDAHMGAHSRRSDLECLGYNLIFWSQGYLPWKDAAKQHQQEKVHRAKEYLMTDVREMLKQIYGKQVPKFLGEFLHNVGELAYHERPDYRRIRRIFEREYQELGYNLVDMRLDSHEIMRTSVRFKEEIENKKDIFEMNKMNVLSIMKNLTTVGTPFHESTLTNRVSPKNLRSKSDKKASKKKKFSWAEILSQDPDQIARERAEKEFDREEELSDVQQPIVKRYEGKPTYAILELQQRMKMSGRSYENPRSVDNEQRPEDTEDDEQDEYEMEECEEDTDNEEAEDSNDEEDEDVETDDTEVSEHTPQMNCRTRRTTRGLTTQSFLKTSPAITRANTGRKKAAAAFNGRAIKSTSKTRTRSGTSAQKSTTKRSGITRSTGRSVGNVASAAGEEHNRVKYPHNHDIGGNVGHQKQAERRTRRCLIKTDTKDVTEGEESNSNFSPDMQGLFNVWKKINNESIYFKGNASASASAKHFKK